MSRLLLIIMSISFYWSLDKLLPSHLPEWSFAFFGVWVGIGVLVLERAIGSIGQIRVTDKTLLAQYLKASLLIIAWPITWTAVR